MVMTGCFLAAGTIVSLILQYAMWMMMTVPPGPPSFDEWDTIGPAAASRRRPSCEGII